MSSVIKILILILECSHVSLCDVCKITGPEASAHYFCIMQHLTSKAQCGYVVANVVANVCNWIFLNVCTSSLRPHSLCLPNIFQIAWSACIILHLTDGKHTRNISILTSNKHRIRILMSTEVSSWQRLDWNVSSRISFIAFLERYQNGVMMGLREYNTW